MKGTTVVIPCHDEARRLDVDAFRRFARSEPGVRFAMLAPDGEPGGRSGYTLYLESRRGPPADLGDRLDRRLGENPHYRYCRTRLSHK